MSNFRFSFLKSGLLACAVLFASALTAQVPVYRLSLQDSSKVDVFLNQRGGPHQYYYLPTKLRPALQSNGEPQFSFLAYAPEDGQPVSGAIMHMLLIWGLSSDEEEQATRILRSSYDSLGVIIGAAPFEPVEDQPYTFTAKGDQHLAEMLTRNLSNAGGVPNVPGGKWAASFRFADSEAREMQKAVAHPSVFKQVTLTFHLRLEGLGQYNLSRTLDQLIPTQK